MNNRNKNVASLFALPALIIVQLANFKLVFERDVTNALVTAYIPCIASTSFSFHRSARTMKLNGNNDFTAIRVFFEEQ